MPATNSSLGAVVGDVLEALGFIDAYFDDPMSAYAPSECGALHARHCVQHAKRIVEEAGYASYDCFLNEVRDRVSGKWFHFSGLSMVGDER